VDELYWFVIAELLSIDMNEIGWYASSLSPIRARAIQGGFTSSSTTASLPADREVL
jgi:hypothetical protein